MKRPAARQPKQRAKKSTVAEPVEPAVVAVKPKKRERVLDEEFKNVADSDCDVAPSDDEVPVKPTKTKRGKKPQPKKTFTHETKWYALSDPKFHPTSLRYIMPWQVHKALLWVRMYGAECPKRTCLVSNSGAIKALQTGKLVKSLYLIKVETTVK